MLTRSFRTVRFACGAGLLLLFSVHNARGQEPKSPPAAAPATAQEPKSLPAAAPSAAQEPKSPPAKAAPTVEEPKSPSDAALSPAQKAAKAPAEPAAATPGTPPAAKAPAQLILPPFDYLRLAHPNVAEQLELTDQQRAAVAQLITQRATDLAAAEASKRPEIMAAVDQKLAALLDEGQLAKLATMAETVKLRFNFRFQKWDDVLDWFARQAGLALVMDQPPAGAFTYSDNRSYTPTEAIDLLNSVLLTKGFTLIQRNRMLILVNLSDDLSQNLIPRVAPEEISQRGKFEIISVLYPLGRRPADGVVKEITPLLGKYGSCVGLPQTGQLLVTETAGKLQAISILVASIPEPPAPKPPEKPPEKPAPPPPVLGVYPVTAIDPAAAVDMLKVLFPNAKFEIDESVDQIMAYTTPNEQTEIKKAVDNMQANRPPETRPRLEIYPIELPDTEQLAEQLEAALPNVKATVDTALGRLLVFAEPKDQEQVKEMIQKLGAAPEGGAKQVVVYQPKHFDPAALATLVKQLIPRAEISSDVSLRRVVVSASAAHQTIVKSLVEQLDQESALEDTPLLQVYALEKMMDATVLSTLTSMIPDAKLTLSTDGRQLMAVARVVDQTVVKKLVDQWTQVTSEQEEPTLKIYPLEESLAAADLTMLKSLVPSAQATLSTDGRQLNVVARAAEHSQVESLLRQFSEAATTQGKPTLKVYPLEQVLTATDLTTFQSLVPDAKVTLSTDGRQLSVIARAADQTEIETLLKQYSDAMTAQGKPALKVYPLEHVLSATDVTTFQSLVPDAKVTLSTDGRRLNVVARAEDQTSVESLIKQLEQAATQEGKPELAVYPLKRPLNPTVLASFTTLVPGAQVTISADTKQLIVVARAEDQTLIKKTLDQIATSTDAAARQQLEIYQVDGIPATQLQTLLQPLALQSTMTIDTPLDRLIVWGPDQEHAAFAAVIAKLTDDPLSGTKPVLEFYPLADESLSTSVTTVMTTLAPSAKVTWDPDTRRLMVIAPPREQQVVRQTIEQMTQDGVPLEKPILRLYSMDSTQRMRFQTVQPDLLKEYPGMRVIEDPQTGELAIWAKATQHEKLAEVLEQLKATDETVEKPILIGYSIEHGSAKAVFDMLKELYPTIKSSFDEKSDRIAVIAPLSQHGRIKQLIAQLDVESGPSSKEELRSYNVGDANPTTLMPMLQSLVPDMQLTTDLPGKKIIASGTVRDHDTLKKAIEQFRTLEPGDRPTVKVYPMEGRSSTSLIYLRSVLAQVAPEAVIAIDMRGGAIVVSGRASEQEAIKSAIDQFVEMDRMAEWQLEAYTLDKLKSDQVITMLRPVVPEAQLSVGAVPDQIVVWGSEEDHKRVKAAIEKLEQSAGAEGANELRVHKIKKAAALQATSIIAKTLPNLQVLAGQGTEQLLIWGSAKDHELLQELIQQLEKELKLDVEREMKTFELDDVDPAEARRVLDSAVGDLEYVVSTLPGRLVIWAEPAKHADVEKVLDELKKAVAAPEQIVKVHKYDVDQLSVSTVYSALSPADMKDLSIQVNAATNSLIVRGAAERQEELAQTLSQLATQLPTVEKPVAEIYRLTRADLTSTTLVVRSLVPTAVVAADATNQTLAITATAKDHARIKAIVDQLDAGEGGELITETYVLKKAYPTYLMTALQPVVPRARISPDIYNKTLIVTATAEDHTKIKAIVEQADGRGDGELTTKAYPLQWANASAIMTALTPIVPNATLSPDVYSKMLIVTANEADHKRVESVLEQADRRGGGDLITKAYPLKWANSATISVALTSVVPDAKVSPDTLNKMLIVTASEKDHARIQAVLDQADKRGGGGDLVTKAYTLQSANPSTISVALTPVVPNATISSDPTNSMLVVTASEEDHVRIKAIIDEADRHGEGELTTEVYALKWANPTALSYSLKPIAPRAVMSPDIYNKTLIVTASTKDHERIKPVIDQADTRGGGDMTTQAYILKWANVTTISTALTSVVPDAKISSDVYNKMLIVTASKEDHDKIQSVLEQADKRGGGDLTTKAYMLHTANPSTIMVALTTVVPDAKVSSDPTNQMLIATASEEDHKKIQEIVDAADRREDGELTTVVYSLKWANPTALSYSLKPIAPTATVSPDIYNKTLIVTASKKDHDRIKVIVEQADTRGGGNMTTQAYILKWANVTTISTALTSVVPDAKISSDTYNKMLIVTASKEDHDKIQSVLEQADKRGGGDLTTKAYTLHTANPSTIMVALTAVVPDAKVSSDPTNQMLIATASDEDQKKIQEIVDAADRREDGELTTVVYTLKWANATALSSSLRPIAPSATVSPDVYNKTLIVTASKKDHERIKLVVEQADRRGQGDLITKAYGLKWANPTIITTALMSVVPEATISSDAYNKMVIATASPDDHDRIQAVLDQADKRGGGDLTTKAYTMRIANPSTIMLALRPVLPDATISADPTNQVLIVTASEEDHTRVKTIVDQTDRQGDGELSTKVYAFTLANPASIATALKALIPGATISSDAGTNTLIVTTTEVDHKLIEPLVKELDVADPKSAVLKPYKVDNADPKQVYESLTQLFRTSRDVSVGYQDETGMILVFAPAAEQEKVGQAIIDIDKATQGRPKATLEVYSLEGMDGDAAVETLRALLVDEIPKVDLQQDDTNNQVLAIAEPSQHEVIRKALSQLTSEEREVEVFALQRVDPYTADSAIATLFADLPFAATPSVEADPDTQQLIVRATKSQLERIRQLLEKMGEGPGAQRATGSDSMLRVLPLTGDVETTLRQIERIWPQVRGNQIQIVTPPKTDAPESTPRNPALPPAKPADDTAPDGKPDQSNSGARGDRPKSADTGGAMAYLVSAQTTLPQTEEDPAVQENGPADTASQPTGSPVPQRPEDPAAAALRSALVDPTLPPIVVIAGEGRVTVASRDKEALDQFEKLLKTLQRGKRVAISTGSFSMFILQNAAAQKVAEVLNDLFRRGSRGGGESYRSSYRRTSNLNVVADERMNALMVYGSSADRSAIEEMLDVLDSVDIPESLSTERPRMIPVKNLPAATVLNVLKSVYQTQLSARRGIQPFTIPQGVSPELTTMLQLVNASAEAPILTLDIDDTTNSIVMRAPRQLGEEIEEFVQELDDQAKDGGTRNITLVPLKGMNAEQIQDALQLLMRRGRYRGRQ